MQRHLSIRAVLFVVPFVLLSFATLQAAENQGLPAEDGLSVEELDAEAYEDNSHLYTSPQGILADFFGRRRSGLLVHGLEDLVGITATGISPLFVLSVSAPAVYFLTEPDARAELIFLYQPWFFIPIILAALLVAFKDTVLTFASYAKIPLDVLGVIFHVLGFLIGFRLIYHLLDIQVSAESGAGGQALKFALLALMLAFYCSVWLLSNFFEVLILINPFPFVDTVLRVGRILFLLAMYVACWIHPALGAAMAVPILIVSLLMFEKTLRAMLMGLRIAYDLVLWRRDQIEDLDSGITVLSFFGGGLPWLALGKLVQRDGVWNFRFRRYSIGPHKHIPLPQQNFAVGAGSMFPVLVAEGANNGERVVLRFPSSLRGQEEKLAQLFDCNAVDDMRWSTTINSGWAWVKGRFASEESTANSDPPLDGAQSTPNPST